jgi:hypothetical protein
MGLTIIEIVTIFFMLLFLGALAFVRRELVVKFKTTFMKGRVAFVEILSKTMTSKDRFLVDATKDSFEYKGKTYYLVDNKDSEKSAIIYDMKTGVPIYLYVEGNPTPIHIDPNRDVLISPELFNEIALSMMKEAEVRFVRTVVDLIKKNWITILGVGLVLALILYYMSTQIIPHEVARIIGSAAKTGAVATKSVVLR